MKKNALSLKTVRKKEALLGPKSAGQPVTCGGGTVSGGLL